MSKVSIIAAHFYHFSSEQEKVVREEWSVLELFRKIHKIAPCWRCLSTDCSSVVTLDNLLSFFPALSCTVLGFLLHIITVTNHLDLHQSNPCCSLHALNYTLAKKAFLENISKAASASSDRVWKLLPSCCPVQNYNPQIPIWQYWHNLPTSVFIPNYFVCSPLMGIRAKNERSFIPETPTEKGEFCVHYFVFSA